MTEAEQGNPADQIRQHYPSIQVMQKVVFPEPGLVDRHCGGESTSMERCPG